MNTVITEQQKQQAHCMIERLAPEKLSAVVHLAEVMIDDDIEDSDTLSPAEAKAIAEADEWSKHNAPIPMEEVLADLGLTMADWESMAQTRSTSHSSAISVTTSLKPPAFVTAEGLFGERCG